MLPWIRIYRSTYLSRPHRVKCTSPEKPCVYAQAYTHSYTHIYTYINIYIYTYILYIDIIDYTSYIMYHLLCIYIMLHIYISYIHIYIYIIYHILYITFWLDPAKREERWMLKTICMCKDASQEKPKKKRICLSL